jgi:hypothetical protein
MSVPPYVCGAFGLYLFAFSSDRQKERGFHILAGLTICLIGLIITVTVHHTPSRYAGLCILTFGSYVSAPLTAAWLSGNTPGEFIYFMYSLVPQNTDLIQSLESARLSLDSTVLAIWQVSLGQSFSRPNMLLVT